VCFFPGRNNDRNDDRNMSPVLSTLVWTGATHLFELDFYLRSYSAIKGIAHDDPKMLLGTSNFLPGALVEACVTHPFELDYYLCSPSAIKGTACPVSIIANENNYDTAFLEQLAFEQCMQFARSTTKSKTTHRL